MARFDEFGAQLPDDTPVEMPLHIRRLDKSLSVEDVRNMVRLELSNQAMSQGFESLKESDDFDVEDDEPEFSSAFEMKEEFEREPLPDDRKKPPRKGAAVGGGAGGHPPAPKAQVPAQPAVEPVKANKATDEA